MLQSLGQPLKESGKKKKSITDMLRKKRKMESYKMLN